MLPVLFALLHSTPASAATLPGIALEFDVLEADRWVLPEDLPALFLDVGALPGWELTAIDGRAFTDGVSAQRQVLTGPGREVQLHFLTPPEDGAAPVDGSTPSEETILIVPRAELILVSELGLLPWPEGFVPGVGTWLSSSGAEPLLLDAAETNWVFDPATGALTPFSGSAWGERSVPEVWWSLSGVELWAVDRSQGLEAGGVEWAREQFGSAVRVMSFQGRSGDHLVLAGDEGLQVLTAYCSL